MSHNKTVKRPTKKNNKNEQKHKNTKQKKPKSHQNPQKTQKSTQKTPNKKQSPHKPNRAGVIQKITLKIRKFKNSKIIVHSSLNNQNSLISLTTTQKRLLQLTHLHIHIIKI